MAMLKQLVAALVMPLPLAALLGLAGVLALWWGWRRAGPGLLAGALALVLLTAWGPVADRLLGPLERTHPALLEAPPGAATAVVVLGSGYTPDPSLPITSELGPTAALRLMEGVRLFHQLDGDARLVVSGGSRIGGPSSAQGYAEAAVALGVSPEAVVRLDHPLDTAQEARAVAELLGDEPFLLVTSASHMARSVRHFRYVGLDPLPAPTFHKAGDPPPHRLGHWVPSARHLRKSERALYEFMGLLAYRLDH